MQRWKTMAAVAALVVVATVWADDKPVEEGTKQALPRAPLAGPEFTVKLSLEGGHVGEVYFGCAAGATDAYDRKMDDLVPPPGIGGVGYTFFVPPDRKMNFYRDLRAPAKVTQWLFYGRVAKVPVELSWDPKTLPPELDFFAAIWDGKATEVGEVLNMRKTDKLTLEKTAYVRIWTRAAK